MDGPNHSSFRQQTTDFINNATDFIMDPSNSRRKPANQSLAWVTTIFLGIVTMGAAHGLSALWRRLSVPNQENETHAKITAFFQKIFSKRHPTSKTFDNDVPNKKRSNDIPHEKLSNDIPHEKLSNDIPHKKPSNVITPLAEPLSPEAEALKLKNCAQSVWDIRKELYDEALHEAQKAGVPAQTIFISKIRNKFKENELSLSQLEKHKELRDLFFKSSLLRPALVEYASINKLTNITNDHLIYVAQTIDQNKNVREAANDNEKLENAITFIFKFIQQEGRTVEEIITNPLTFEIFKENVVLSAFLFCYKQAKENPQSQHSKEDANPKAQNARDLAAQIVEKSGPGLLTIVGLNQYGSNPQGLKKELHKLLLREHPDKNPNSDEKKVQAANELIDLIKHNVLPIYLNALAKMRKK
jgi:hypothetical protein